MRIHRSAYRHGVSDEAIRHALRHALTSHRLDDDRTLCLGPDHAANLLELVVLTADDGTENVIHAAPMTDKWRSLLP